MPINIFGFALRKKKNTSDVQSIVSKKNNDGAIVLNTSYFSSNFSNLDAAPIDEFHQITKYREMALHHDCADAIDEVVNDAIVYDETKPPTSINLDNLEIPEKIKEVIRQKFDKIVALLNYREDCYEIFKQFYIDGKMYYHKIIDINDTKKGLIEVRQIDPRTIRLVREVEQHRDPETGVDTVKDEKEYYIFSSTGILGQGQGMGLGNYTNAGGGAGFDVIAPDSICYIHSGITDQWGHNVVSYLHRAIRPLNLLSLLEDALIIYRVSRAPERRVFYIDTAGMQPRKAEEYMSKIINEYKNKVLFDPSSGEIRDDRRHSIMSEDLWIPRSNGSQGTQVSTLPGGQNLGELTDVDYFRTKLYRALNVPEARMASDDRFMLGRSSEITKREVKFSKFISRLRSRFNHLFLDLLRTELILCNVVTPEEWDEIKEHISFSYISDSMFTELREAEVLRERVQTFKDVEPIIGVYVSKKWVQTNVFKMTDEEINKMDAEIKLEKQNALDTSSNDSSTEEIPEGETKEEPRDPKLLSGRLYPEEEEFFGSDLVKQSLSN